MMVNATPQEHIQWLEQQLEAKKRELQETGQQKHERELVKEIIQDVSAEKTTPPPLLPAQQIPTSPTQYTIDEEEKQHEDIIQKLVEIAVTKDLLGAMKAARALQNPHLLDDFHDTLADRYYEKLLEARKIAL